jgi:hypothetical protein
MEEMIESGSLMPLSAANPSVDREGKLRSGINNLFV